MGKIVCCGLITRIEIKGNNLQKYKDDILKRIDKFFNLKYYEVSRNDDNYMCLYLKEDVANTNLKDLFLELTDFYLFIYYFHLNIDAIRDKCYNSYKEAKKQVVDYLKNHFDLRIKRDYKKRFGIIDENSYEYFLENFMDESEINLSWKNNLFCKDLSDKLLFDADINPMNFHMKLKIISLCLDNYKTYSKDISFTMKHLNYFFRKSLKSDLKSTVVFGLVD